MIGSKDKKIASLYKSRLKKLTPLVRFVVYGSRVRGDATPDSDMDIFIEVPELTPELRRKISELAWEIGFEHEIVISPFVVTHQNIMEGPLGANPILMVIARDGVPL